MLFSNHKRLIHIKLLKLGGLGVYVSPSAAKIYLSKRLCAVLPSVCAPRKRLRIEIIHSDNSHSVLPQCCHSMLPSVKERMQGGDPTICSQGLQIWRNISISRYKRKQSSLCQWSFILYELFNYKNANFELPDISVHFLGRRPELPSKPPL